MTKLNEIDFSGKKIICSLGGGFSSSAFMPRLLLGQFPKDQIEFVNCVLPNEHPDMWKLFDAVEIKLGISIKYIAYHSQTKYQIVSRKDRDNKDELLSPFDIFMEQGFIGNTRLDPCSRILKRETIYNYISSKFSPNDCVIAVGIHDAEIERSISIRENWEDKGYKTYFPLLGIHPFDRNQELRLMKQWYGISLELYEKGFEHNNCGGACVKAGQRQWAMLWFYYPEVYAEWERLELEWNAKWSDIRGKVYSILKIQRNKHTEYILLKDFREQLLEPAYNGDVEGFLSKFLRNLPRNPGCMWCSAI